MKNRFNSDALQHFCQRSSDGSVIFYSLEDYIVFTSILFHFCREADIRPRAVCIMRNHFHLEAFVRSRGDGAKLMGMVCSHFSMQYNLRRFRVKTHFKEGYSRSEKWEDKDRKSCDIYIGNNPVGKRACKSAYDYRWNFLRYYDNTNPWSETVSPYKESKKMKIATITVDDTFRRGHYLTYSQVESMFSELSPNERERLADYVIIKYSNIEYSSISSEFGSFENYLSALDTISGADYEIKDDLSKEDYRHYDLMDAALAKYGLVGNMKHLHEYAPDRFANMIHYLKNYSGATVFELSRYLHVTPETINLALKYGGKP